MICTMFNYYTNRCTISLVIYGSSSGAFLNVYRRVTVCNIILFMQITLVSRVVRFHKIFRLKFCFYFYLPMLSTPFLVFLFHFEQTPYHSSLIYKTCKYVVKMPSINE
jgi:hypothetical protein